MHDGRVAARAVRRIDYDTEQYRDYARGRALSDVQVRTWMDAFAAVLPRRRPLLGLDVGSGTGRFAPALAETFGPVTGVEPSMRMREIAEVEARHRDVRYVAGSAEAIPVSPGSADYALLFLSWHHVTDKTRAVRELTRAVRSGGRLLLRENFCDHHPRPWWLEQAPGWFEADAAQFQPLHEVIEMFVAGGWRVVAFGWVTEPADGTLADMLDRLRLRTLSLFGQLDEAEIVAGLRTLEAFVSADPGVATPEFAEPLLTLERR